MTTYTYYDNGSRDSVIYNDGSKEEYTYYANNQIETLVNKKSDGSVMDRYSYTYDNAGNQLTKQETINGIVKGTTTYTYDILNRLLTVTEPNGRITTYGYDVVGNRSKETIVYGVITTENSYAYNNQNRLTDITTKVNNVLTEVTSYAYDKNGNQLTSVVKSYVNGTITSVRTTATNTYDLHNQLTKAITEDGTIVNNTYNAQGYRVGKEVNGEQTYYLYEYDKVILEVDGAGNQIARNVYGTNLLRRTVEGETYYYMYNGHADVTALIRTDGTIAATYYYDAFGNILESTGDINNSILYSGYQYDKETGLYYLNARMYDSKIARFLQEDTYLGDLNDPLSLNLYSYCVNNPLVYYDPTGHFWKEVGDFFNATGKRVKAVGKGAYNIVAGALEPTAMWITHGTGPILKTLGVLDDQSYKYYMENSWNEIEAYSKAPNVLRIATDPLAAAFSAEYLFLTQADKQTWKNYRDNVSRDYLSSLNENALSALQPFQVVFSKENAYNFFCNRDASDDQLEQYATNAIAVGMIAYGGAKGVSAIKPSITNIGKPVFMNGELALANAYTMEVAVDASLALNGLGYGTAGYLAVNQYNNSAKGASNTKTYTKSSLKMGQEMHKAYKSGVVDNITKFKEFRLPSGKRIDFIDFETKTIYELKPYNPNGLKSGAKQLEGYLKEVESIYGDGWKTMLDTY